MRRNFNLVDHSSQSNVKEVCQEHVDLALAVDFDRRRIYGVAAYRVRVMAAGASTAKFDTAGGMSVTAVEVEQEPKGGSFAPARFALRPPHTVLGKCPWSPCSPVALHQRRALLLLRFLPRGGPAQGPARGSRAGHPLAL